MLNLLKLKVWITIVLLSYSTNLLASNDINHTNSSTGELVQSSDSVLIAYDDLRIVNSKLIELKYEKDINESYRRIISNDSIIINKCTNLNISLNEDCKRAIRQRNIAICSGALITVLGTILLLLK